MTLLSPTRDAVRPRPEWLAAISAGLAEAPDLWRRRVRHDPERHTYSLLLATPVYDAWVLGWSPGQGIPLHDHGGSAGAVCVVEGRLVEVHAPEVGEAHAPETGSDVLATRILEPGAPVTFGSRHRHGITNLHDAAATSIHVYSPPLAVMTYYDADGGTATSWVR